MDCNDCGITLFFATNIRIRTADALVFYPCFPDQRILLSRGSSSVEMVDLHAFARGNCTGISGHLSCHPDPCAQQSSDADNATACDHRSDPDDASPTETHSASGGRYRNDPIGCDPVYSNADGRDGQHPEGADCKRCPT